MQAGSLSQDKRICRSTFREHIAPKDTVCPRRSYAGLAIAGELMAFELQDLNGNLK